jgi:dTDP-4-amino-4,6-dideoxygalactose transaminase
MALAETHQQSQTLQVPLLDLKPQYQALKTQIQAAIDGICASQAFILGPAVKELEQHIAEYSRSRHAIGVSSGTDALLVALMALEIGPGDEVITTPFTFFATAGTIARVGARPLFCDIERVTFNLKPAAVESLIGEQCDRSDQGLVNRHTGGRVKAVMPVHLYGQMAPMGPLMDIASRYGLAVIEDAAQAIGADDAAGRRAGSLGRIGCLSFFPTKNLGAFGDAGMCLTSDAGLAERLVTLRVHGGGPKYYHSFIGGNFRLDELQAAVLNVKLPYLDGWTAARQENAAYYGRAFAAARLGDAVQIPWADPQARHVYNQYVVRVRDRDHLRKRLTEHGVATEIYYPVPLHLQRCFAYLGYQVGDLPESERAARETLALPVYPEIGEDRMQYVVDCVARFYG